MQKWISKDVIAQGQIVTELGLSSSKFHDWTKRYGNKNQHNAPIPRWFWLLESEKEAILAYYEQHPEGRILPVELYDAGLKCGRCEPQQRLPGAETGWEVWSVGKKTSGKGKGFEQHQKAHQHWHIDLAYVKLGGTFY
ncbi:MAG: hypothetical protein R6U51_12185 [Anaerolineales bacterium]